MPGCPLSLVLKLTAGVRWVVTARPPSGRRVLSLEAGVFCMRAELLQVCLTLSDPMDCILPGSTVHGTLQARILEWVAMPFSRESS